MGYTALRQLSAVKDWLGETKIRRDAAGAPIEITDHKGRTVSYEWGSMGERKSITYPDGRKALYQYDELLRLQKMQIEKNTEDSAYLPGFGRTAGRFEEINYKYDEMGRISEKLFPEGMHTKWLYDERGQLRELVHEDDRGILDRYRYEYDLMGNKTAITKERRGLKEESGRYEYGYDGLSRLASVSKDGNAIRTYAYDSFGNRSSLEDLEKGRSISYHYDALNRLMFKAEGEARTDYGYDGRGNLVREEMEGKLVHGYEYGAMNCLSKSWNDNGGESLYLYNGLGQRMGRSINGREEDYLLDLTKPYHNLMGIYEGKECIQRFYLDGTAVAMEEASKGKKTSGRTAFSGLHYYLQDELGSPIRVSGFRFKESAVAGRNNYLTYGYDEFGNDLGKELEEAGIPNPYDGQGVEQPFGYTGYRYDEGSGTYFAQAREYKAIEGRFMGKDSEKYILTGNILSNNLYVYCRNSPLGYTDSSGNEVVIVTGGIDDKSAYDYMFVETALKGANDFIDAGVPKEDISWIVVDAGYTDEQMNNFSDTAGNLGINFVPVDNKEEFVTYINEKDGGVTRAEDQIKGMMFFCHEESQKYAKDCENQLSFAYGIKAISDEKKANINFTQSDIELLDPDAFDEALTIFFSCNAGTKDTSGKSFAQEWSNKTGGLSYGIADGRTFYGAINMAASYGMHMDWIGTFAPGELINWIGDTDLWKEKQRRSKDRVARGYSELGSLNYPCMVSLAGDMDVLFSGSIFNRGWKEFMPEENCSN